MPPKRLGMSASMGPDFSPEAKAKFDEIVARYPERQAALLPILHLAQHEFGHLRVPVQELAARSLDVPATLVHEVTTFYEMFHQEPEGQFHIEVCTNIACHLLGADALMEHVKAKLGIEVGHQTADGLFSLMEAECLASCGSGPVVKVGLDYYEHVTCEAVDVLLEDLKQKSGSLEGKHYHHAEPEPHVGPVKGHAPPAAGS